MAASNGVPGLVPPKGVGPKLTRVVVINDVATARGGATGLALLSIRLLREAGIPVTLIVGDADGNAEIEALGVDIVRLGGRHIAQAGRLNALTNGLYNRPAETLLRRWIAENDRPGMVYHVHGWSKILSPSIFRALGVVAGRTILHAHDFFLACPNGAFQDYRRQEPCPRVPLGVDCLTTNCDKRSYAQKLWRVARHEGLARTLDHRFDATPVLMIHELMAEPLERSGFAPDRLRVLRNPVEPFTSERIAAEDNDVFYFVGRIEAEKGVEDAAAAASLAGVKMRFIGDGPDRAALEAKYPDIEVLGWSSRERIGALLQDARALVMPSRYPEPFGLVAAEASRSGLPVILSDTALLAGEFSREGLGLSTRVGDPVAFAAALRQIADLPRETIQAMSLRAFARDIPIATTPQDWRDRLVGHYEERLVSESARVAKTSSVDRSSDGLPRVRLFNVKFSPNLGDGLLSEALEMALGEQGLPGDKDYSVDLSGRTAYGPGTTSRSTVLKALNWLPKPLRQASIRVPLELMMQRRWKPHYRRGLAGTDAVVIGGGNLFSDMDLNFPVKLSAVLGLAAEARLPAAIYGVGVADHWSPAGIAMVRRALGRARPCYVSVRDEASRRSFDRLFADAAGRPAIVVRDPGLLISRYVPSERREGEAAPIGICVMSAIAVSYHSDLRTSAAELGDWYVALCKRLEREGRPLVVFTNGSPEDEGFLDGIEGRMAGATQLVRRRVTTPRELAGMLSGFSAVVAHRMHALIAAYSFGVPIFALEWDKKVNSFMASIGAADDLAPAEASTIDRVADGVARLLRREADGRHEAVVAEALQDVAGLAEALRREHHSRRS